MSLANSQHIVLDRYAGEFALTCASKRSACWVKRDMACRKSHAANKPTTTHTMDNSGMLNRLLSMMQDVI